MLSIPDAARIYYCATPVKMSRSYDGLCGAVRSSLGRDPCEPGSIFVFVNRRRTMVKVLCWEGDGFSIWGKRLERGQFNLPSSADGRITLEYRELVAMLAGIRPGRYYRRHFFRAFGGRVWSAGFSRQDTCHASAWHPYG